MALLSTKQAQERQFSALQKAVATLRRGGLIALPTETVYGLGADAANETAVRRIFRVKGRPATHPLIVHVESFEAACDWVSQVPPIAAMLAKAFWPGPLTLVMRKSPRVADVVTGGQDTIALRVPAHALALSLLRAFGGGVAAPSANRFGQLSPTSALHVCDALGDNVDYVLDGGSAQVGVESTIVDVTTSAPRLLRPGGIPREAIETLLGSPLRSWSGDVDVRVPGMCQSHYAPRAALYPVQAAFLSEAIESRSHTGARVVVLAPADVLVAQPVTRLEVPSDVAGFAKVLYAQLHKADAFADVILVVLPPEAGLGHAVRDRLMRAASRGHS